MLSVVLNLTAGSFSRFGSYEDVAIAYGVSIENAIGGNAADVLTGNVGIGGINSGGHAEGANLFGVENVTGPAFGDVIVGSDRLQRARQSR